MVRMERRLAIQEGDGIDMLRKAIEERNRSALVALIRYFDSGDPLNFVVLDIGEADLVFVSLGLADTMSFQD